jgi:hypothetical protein
VFDCVALNNNIVERIRKKIVTSRERERERERETEGVGSSRERERGSEKVCVPGRKNGQNP